MVYCSVKTANICLEKKKEAKQDSKYPLSYFPGVFQVTESSDQISLSQVVSTEVQNIRTLRLHWDTGLSSKIKQMFLGGELNN